jgi:hypothetical protein
MVFGFATSRANVAHFKLNETMETPASKSLTYIDGNNNKYIITKLKSDAKIEYVPIKAWESSSGTYDGGDAYSINITLIEHKELISLIDTGIKDVSQQSEDRNMGCGTIIKSQSKIFFLKMDSYSKSTIEKKLKELKANYLVSQPTSDKNNGDTLILNGKIVERSFESKKGVMTDIKEFYFIPNESEIAKYKLAKDYFVKLSKGKVNRETLKGFVDKTVSWKLIVMRGLWDADDNTHQSRFGDYVILLENKQ